MNFSSAVMLINENIRAIRCVYEPQVAGKPEPKTYIFKSLDKTIEKDDLVIVPSTTRYQRAVVKVVEVDAEVDYDSPVQVEWIVGKLNNADYLAIKKVEGDCIEKIKASEKREKQRALLAKMTEHNKELFKNLPIANMKTLPGVTPHDTSAASVENNPSFTYNEKAAPAAEEVEF